MLCVITNKLYIILNLTTFLAAILEKTHFFELLQNYYTGIIF